MFWHSMIVALPPYAYVVKQKKLQNTLHSSQRQQASFNPQDFTTIISNPELLQKFLYWFMSLKRLNQFDLAFKRHQSHSNI